MKRKVIGIGWEETPEELEQGVQEEVQQGYQPLEDALDDARLSGDDESDTVSDLKFATRALARIGDHAFRFESKEAKALAEKVGNLGLEAMNALHTVLVNLEVCKDYVRELQHLLEEDKQFALRVHNNRRG